MPDLDAELLPDPLPGEPFGLFSAWFEHARAAARQPNPNCMTLATVDADGRPSARVVLCKGIDPAMGRITFYTNYQSRKARELESSGRASVVFHWDHDDRQVRMEGVITRASAEMSDAYYASRRWESRIGAWASRQSEPLESREQLMNQVAETIGELGLDLSAIVAIAEEGPASNAKIEIPRPPFWGGYHLIAEAVELWCAGEGRIHDRARWQRTVSGDPADPEVGPWSATRLNP